MHLRHALLKNICISIWPNLSQRITVSSNAHRNSIIDGQKFHLIKAVTTALIIIYFLKVKLIHAQYLQLVQKNFPGPVRRKAAFVHGIQSNKRRFAILTVRLKTFFHQLMIHIRSPCMRRKRSLLFPVAETVRAVVAEFGV